MTTEQLAEKIVDTLRPDMQGLTVNPGYDQAWANRELEAQKQHRDRIVEQVATMIEASQPESCH